MVKQFVVAVVAFVMTSVGFAGNGAHFNPKKLEANVGKINTAYLESLGDPRKWLNRGSLNKVEKVCIYNSMNRLGVILRYAKKPHKKGWTVSFVNKDVQALIFSLSNGKSRNKSVDGNPMHVSGFSFTPYCASEVLASEAGKKLVAMLPGIKAIADYVNKRAGVQFLYVDKTGFGSQKGNGNVLMCKKGSKVARCKSF
jgi:hypothetical protein